MLRMCICHSQQQQVCLGMARTAPHTPPSLLCPSHIACCPQASFLSPFHPLVCTHCHIHNTHLEQHRCWTWQCTAHQWCMLQFHMHMDRCWAFLSHLPENRVLQQVSVLKNGRCRPFQVDKLCTNRSNVLQAKQTHLDMHLCSTYVPPPTQEVLQEIRLELVHAAPYTPLPCCALFTLLPVPNLLIAFCFSRLSHALVCTNCYVNTPGAAQMLDVAVHSSPVVHIAVPHAHG